MEHDVHIEKIIAGGQGLARLDDGIIAFTPLVIPGERVRIREIKRKRGFIEGELRKILQSSASRRRPPCPFYAVCGGCNLQHASYNAQLDIKKGILADAMQRAHVPLSSKLCRPIQALSPFAYRYRIRLQIDAQGRVGFLKRASKTIVPVNHCLIAADPLNGALAELGRVNDFLKHLKGCPEIELLCSPADGKVFALLLFDKKFPFSSHLTPPEFTSIQGLIVKRGTLLSHFNNASNPLLCQRFSKPDFSLNWQPGCFSQVNPVQNQTLIHLVLTQLGDIQGLRILDLYCGMGNFSIPMGLSGAAGLGIEQNDLSVSWAENNCRAAGITTWQFQAGRVDRLLPRIVQQGSSFDLVFLDPPRTGVGTEIDDLIRLEAKRICYVSCDPATLARDCRKLTDAGYFLLSLTPVDMFPQTHHIESVALLEKHD